jgi:hypothetical protein
MGQPVADGFAQASHVATVVSSWRSIRKSSDKILSFLFTDHTGVADNSPQQNRIR